MSTKWDIGDCECGQCSQSLCPVCGRCQTCRPEHNHNMTRERAEEVIKTCVREIGPGYHPDDSLDGLINLETGEPIPLDTWSVTQEEHNEAYHVLAEIDPELPYIVGLEEGQRLKYWILDKEDEECATEG